MKLNLKFTHPCSTIYDGAFICLTVVLFILMFWQCGDLCIHYYHQPVTTNTFVDFVNTSDFLFTMQLCFTRRHLMNISKAELFGLNKSHQVYLLNYFIYVESSWMTSIVSQFNLTNETSLETYIYTLIDGWNKIETEVVHTAKTFLNSSNPMEFWNFNQSNNLTPLRFHEAHGYIDTASLVGPYTTPPSWYICYEFPSSPVNDLKNSVEFMFNFSINRKEAVGSSFAYFSPYRGNSRVFDDDDYTAVQYVKDSAKYLSYLRILRSVKITKWIALNRRRRPCIEVDEVCFIL